MKKVSINPKHMEFSPEDMKLLTAINERQKQHEKTLNDIQQSLNVFLKEFGELNNFKVMVAEPCIAESAQRSKRISSLERWRIYITGGAAVAVALIGTLGQSWLTREITKAVETGMSGAEFEKKVTTIIDAYDYILSPNNNE